MFKGMQTPFAYSKNHKHVEPKPFAVKFSPMNKKDKEKNKKEDKEVVGPGTYNTADAYKNT